MRDLPARRTYDRLRPYERPLEPCAVDLSDNTNLWGPPPVVREAIREWADEDLTRYPSVYGQKLATAIAQRHGVDFESVVTGCGSDDVLDSTLRALGRPGQTLVCYRPTFSMATAFAWMNELEVVELDASPADVRKMSSELDRIERTASGAPQSRTDESSPTKDAPDIVYLCRPNNPTGECMPEEIVEAWLRLPNRPWVIVDEAYADFARTSLDRWVERFPNLVILRTLSKLYGLAGLRVGYSLSHADTAAEIRKSRGPFKVNRIAERVAERALRESRQWTEEVIDEVEANRTRLGEEVRSLGLEVRPSRANFVLVSVPAGLEATGLAAKLETHGVRVRPFPDLGSSGALRVTIGPWNQMEAFLRALRLSLDESAARPRVAILDYGAGNLRSLSRALETVGADVRIETSVQSLTDYDAIVLPGVGSFATAVGHFDRDPGSRDRFVELLRAGTPCLGICLGMQFLHEASEEADGRSLGWFPGKTVRLRTPINPHMGWARIEAPAVNVSNAVVDGVSRPSGETLSLGPGWNGRSFYFAHGFACPLPADETEPTVLATTRISGITIPAMLQRGSVVATQFHPEKSGSAGLRILRDFVQMARVAAEVTV